jgi:hypothetical protein
MTRRDIMEARTTQTAEAENIGPEGIAHLETEAALRLLDEAVGLTRAVVLGNAAAIDTLDPDTRQAMAGWVRANAADLETLAVLAEGGTLTEWACSSPKGGRKQLAPCPKQ